MTIPDEKEDPCRTSNSKHIHIPLPRYARAHDRFFNRIVTRNEKLCFYVNLKQITDWVALGCAGKPRFRRISTRKKGYVLRLVGLRRSHALGTASAQSDAHQRALRKESASTSQAIQDKRTNRQSQVILLLDHTRPHAVKNTKMSL